MTAAMMQRIVSDDAADDHDDTESLYSVVSSTSHDATTIDPHAALVAMVQQEQQPATLSDEYRRQALAYLLNYETMVRQQEAEDMAVLAHMRPCVARLVELMGASPHAVPNRTDGWNHPSFLTQEISLSQLRNAVSQLEETTPDHHDMVAVPEFMTTDRQLMMVLRLLSSAAAAPNEQDVTLTWAEVIQCYKICIVGMVTLQHLPVFVESNANGNGTTLPHVRARARERTLAMLRLFLEPPNSAVTATSGSDTASTPLSSKDSVPVFRSKTNIDTFTPLTQSSRRGSASYAQPAVKSTDRRTVWFSKSVRTWTRNILLAPFALAALMWLLAPRWNQWVQTRQAPHQPRNTPRTRAWPARGGGGQRPVVVPSRDTTSALSFLDQNRPTVLSLKSRVGARGQLARGEPVQPRAIPLTTHAGMSQTRKTHQPASCHETQSCSAAARFGPLLGIWSNFVKHE
jgi:hypothetical protein